MRLFIANKLCPSCRKQLLVALHGMKDNYVAAKGLVCLQCGREEHFKGSQVFGFYTGKHCSEMEIALPGRFNAKAVRLVLENKRADGWFALPDDDEYPMEDEDDDDEDEWREPVFAPPPASRRVNPPPPAPPRDANRMRPDPGRTPPAKTPEPERRPIPPTEIRGVYAPHIRFRPESEPKAYELYEQGMALWNRGSGTGGWRSCSPRRPSRGMIWRRISWLCTTRIVFTTGTPAGRPRTGSRSRSGTSVRRRSGTAPGSTMS